jgi:hypothetical protein
VGKLSKLTEGDARQGKFFESTDLIAARELARIGIEALKMSRVSGKKSDETVQNDLFDAAQANPWNIKKIE